MIPFMISIMLAVTSATPALAYAPTCQIGGLVSAKKPEKLTVVAFGIREGKESMIASLHLDESGKYELQFGRGQRELYSKLIVRLTDEDGKVLSEKTIPETSASAKKSHCHDIIDF